LSPPALVQRIVDLLPIAPEQYYRLILVVGPAGAGKTEALQEASHKLAEAVYASAQQQTASTASADGNGVGSDDEVVEAGDYEVIDEEQEAPKA